MAYKNKEDLRRRILERVGELRGKLESDSCLSGCHTQTLRATRC